MKIIKVFSLSALVGLALVACNNSSDLTNSPAWWAFVGFNHYWSKTLNSNFSTAWAGTTLASFQADETIQRAGSFHANLI